MRPEPVWIARSVIDAIHFSQLQQHGGLFGIRDENALESALARARNRWAHDDAADIFDLTAAYGFGLSGSHPYADGNKRVAFLAMYVFLGTNGVVLNVPEADVVGLMVDVASQRTSESDLAEWLRVRCEMIDPHGAVWLP